jgi:hypothetical protein
VSFETRTCVVLICEGPTDCDPWDEGIPQFRDEAEAVEFGSGQGWTFRDGRALCSACTREDDCGRRGHQWDEWALKERYGIPYKQRHCEHCNSTDYDPPFAQLGELLQVVFDAEDVLREASR